MEYHPSQTILVYHFFFFFLRKIILFIQQYKFCLQRENTTNQEALNQKTCRSPKLKRQVGFLTKLGSSSGCHTKMYATRLPGKGKELVHWWVQTLRKSYSSIIDLSAWIGKKGNNQSCMSIFCAYLFSHQSTEQR